MRPRSFIRHSSPGHVTWNTSRLLLLAGPSGGVAEKPLSGYARLIRGERSVPNCVRLTPTALPGNCAPPGGGRRDDGRTHFSTAREALGTGRIPRFLFPSLRFPLVSPLSMSCIITSRFNRREMKSNTGKVREYWVG